MYRSFFDLQTWGNIWGKLRFPFWSRNRILSLLTPSSFRRTETCTRRVPVKCRLPLRGKTKRHKTLMHLATLSRSLEFDCAVSCDLESLIFKLFRLDFKLSRLKKWNIFKFSTFALLKFVRGSTEERVANTNLQCTARHIFSTRGTLCSHIITASRSKFFFIAKHFSIPWTFFNTLLVSFPILL